MDRYKITTHVYQDGTLLESAEVGVREGEWEASTLTHNYVCSLVASGGTATFEPTVDEFKIVMPDGQAEYVKYTKI